MARVKAIEIINSEDVYNMEVENHHNFAVNGGLIVHNCDAIRGFIAGRPCPIKVKPKPNFDNSLSARAQRHRDSMTKKPKGRYTDL
jgi:hypothetical protein